MNALIPTLAPTTPLSTPLTPFNAPKIGRNASPQKIADAAKQFESTMISSMLQPMFQGLKTDGPFGGGEAEGTFRSFLVDAIAKQVEKSGGLHLSSAIQSEMIRMQQGHHQ
jgi:Rod binding domain-containing protein